MEVVVVLVPVDAKLVGPVQIAPSAFHIQDAVTVLAENLGNVGVYLDGLVKCARRNLPSANIIRMFARITPLALALRRKMVITGKSTSIYFFYIMFHVMLFIKIKMISESRRKKINMK